MKRLETVFLGVLLALAVLAPAVAQPIKPAGARAEFVDQRPHSDATINVNGIEFQGKWAIIGERPYVGVESFGKALGLPRIHNAKGWQLAEKPMGTLNPLELVVKGPRSKLPTVRHAGVTMVDLLAASDALGLETHHNFYSRTWQIGTPYKGEFLKGAYYRWLAHANNWYNKNALTGVDLNSNYWDNSFDVYPEFPHNHRLKNPRM